MGMNLIAENSSCNNEKLLLICSDFLLDVCSLVSCRWLHCGFVVLTVLFIGMETEK